MGFIGMRAPIECRPNSNEALGPRALLSAEDLF